MDQMPPFEGWQLQVFENRLVDRGTILSWEIAADLICLKTTTGEYTFYCTHPKDSWKNAKILTDGKIKVYGDSPRWAYIVP